MYCTRVYVLVYNITAQLYANLKTAFKFEDLRKAAVEKVNDELDKMTGYDRNKPPPRLEIQEMAASTVKHKTSQD